MAGFIYSKGSLYGDGVDLRSVAEEVGTPCFVYSGRLLCEAYEQFRRALEPLPGLVCYAMKANASAAICRMLASLGCGADVVSGGELFRALNVGFSPERIVFAGVGKTEEEIRLAIEANIRQLNVESLPELDLVDRVARHLETKARIALRVNPNVRLDTHPHIATSSADSKFGISLDDALSVFRHAASLSGVHIVGLHFHLGSQLRSTAPYVKALGKILPLIERLRSLGIRIETLDMGGGLGIPDADESAPSPEEWLGAVKENLRRSRCTVIVEPGRALVGPAGIMLTKVLYLKKTSRKNFLIVDAGMNDLLRPILYGAIHQIIPLRKRGGRPIRLDVVGPVCESADFLARGRMMVPPRDGEVLAVMNVGAYGASMSSNYNGRRRAAEVFVFGQRYALIRRREEFQDLMAGELIPELVLEVCRGFRGGD